MNYFFYLIIFIFGLIVGSFLNCVIYRLEINKSALKGRSFCPHCQHQLSWQDLIPVFSFLFLKGYCRYCHQKISLQYPLIEIATGILFVLIFNHWLLDIGICSLAYLFVISSFLIIIFIYDLKHYIIPDKIIYLAIAIAFLYQLFNHWPLIINNLDFIYSAVGASFFFLLIVLASRGKGMGVGDIKLGFLMGLILGWPNILVALFLAFLIGAIIGIGLIINRKKTLKSEVPFGPFLVTGTFLALFWGENIINWYFRLIFNF